MIALLILGAVGLLVVAFYACLVVASDADRQEEALLAREKRERGEGE